MARRKLRVEVTEDSIVTHDLYCPIVITTRLIPEPYDGWRPSVEIHNSFDRHHFVVDATLAKQLKPLLEMILAINAVCEETCNR